MAKFESITIVIDTLPDARAQVQVNIPTPMPGMRLETAAHSLAIDALGWLGKQPAVAGFVYVPSTQNLAPLPLLLRTHSPAHPAEGVPATATVPEAIDPSQCAQDVLDNGVSVGLFDIPKATANALCAAISAATGARLDWHYIAGRVHMKALATTQPAAQGLDARDIGINHGVCLALQIMTAAGDAGSAQWNELVDVAGRAQIEHYAKVVEPEEWELGGLAQVERSNQDDHAIDAALTAQANEGGAA